MNRRPGLHVLAACGLLLFAGGCEEEVPEPRQLSEVDLSQFNSPLAVSGWNEPGSWPQWGHDPLHTGRSGVDLESPDLQLLWQFRPTNHVYAYVSGYSVWSTPVVGTVDGRPLVIMGHYDNVVYAVDGRTGEKVWEFRPGTHVFASAALARVGNRAMVFLPARNRMIFALDAATGEKLWVVETVNWAFTKAESVMSSLTFYDDGSKQVLLAGVWNSDRSATQNLQRGELLALNPIDGREIWRRTLASQPITTPAVARLAGETFVFVVAHHGQMWALRLGDGSTRWERPLNELSRSSPSVGIVGDSPRVFVGTRFHVVYALDPFTGRKFWRRKVGYWIDATPSWNRVGNDTVVAAGSYDRHVWALDATTGDMMWKQKTGNFAYSSPVWARVGDTPVVIAMSWDEQTYMFDASTGAVLWRAACKPLLWSYATQGDSLWASPVVARMDDQPTLLVAAFDGILYAFGPRCPESATADLSSRNPDSSFAR